MIRKIIKIDEEKCNGCGACADACHEGAIGIVNGKARLLRDDYCDGLGDCLPSCPTEAISFEEREAAEYNEQAVLENLQNKMADSCSAFQHSCQSSAPKTLNVAPAASCSCGEGETPPVNRISRLAQWPCQIKLAPLRAPYFENSRLLVAADCTAFAYAALHEDFMDGRVTLIGCPKLDAVDYSEKLTEIIEGNDIKSVELVRMEVPCCGGLENALRRAIMNSGKDLPLKVDVITIDGHIK